jgi:hypothetical protein
MRTSSLDTQEDKTKEDQDSRILRNQMENANQAIKTLAMELSELQKLVKENILFYLLNISFIYFLGKRISNPKTSFKFSTESVITSAMTSMIYFYFFFHREFF